MSNNGDQPASRPTNFEPSEEAPQRRGSRYLQQFSDILQQIEAEKQAKIGDIKVTYATVTPDPEIYKLWNDGKIEQFNDRLDSFVTFVPSLVAEYHRIIDTPSPSENPFLYFNAGRVWIVSLLEELTALHKRTIETPKIREDSILSLHGWIARCTFLLAINFQQTEEEKHAEQQFLQHIWLWLSIPLEKRNLGRIDGFLAWDRSLAARQELAETLEFLGMAAYKRLHFWQSLGYLKRAQALMENGIEKPSLQHVIRPPYYLSQVYVQLGALGLGFKYCSRTVCDQLKILFHKIDLLHFSASLESASPGTNGTSTTPIETTPRSVSNDVVSNDAVSNVFNDSTIPKLLAELNAWVESVARLRAHWSSMNHFGSAEVLLHASSLVVAKLRLKGSWKGSEGQELNELEAEIYSHIAQHYLNRMEASTKVMGCPTRSTDYIVSVISSDAIAQELRSAEVEHPDTGRNEAFPFNIKQTRIAECRPPSSCDTTNAPCDSATYNFDLFISETVDVPALEVAAWRCFEESPVTSTSASSISGIPTSEAHCLRVCSVVGGRELPIVNTSQILDLPDNGIEAASICGKLNSPILDCEFVASEASDGEPHVVRREFNSNLKPFRSQLEQISPFVCCTADGLQQLLRVVNHYVQLALLHFKLNGWVTKHVNLLLLQSSAYKLLAQVEKSIKRFEALQNRRLKLLGPLLVELSPTHYNHFLIRISVECGRICQDLFVSKATNKNPLLIDTDHAENGPQLTRNVIQSAHQIRRKGIWFYSFFLEAFQRGNSGKSTLEIDQRQLYLTAQESRMKLMAHCSRFIGVEDPPNPSMATETQAALEICKDIVQKVKLWNAGAPSESDNDWTETAETMSRILQIRQLKIQSGLSQQLT